jgi:hypothetical protein
MTLAQPALGGRQGCTSRCNQKPNQERGTDHDRPENNETAAGRKILRGSHAPANHQWAIAGGNALFGLDPTVGAPDFEAIRGYTF